MSKLTVRIVVLLFGALLAIAAIPAFAATPTDEASGHATRQAVAAGAYSRGVASGAFSTGVASDATAIPAVPLAVVAGEGVFPAVLLTGRGLLLVVGAGLVVLAELILLPWAWHRLPQAERNGRVVLSSLAS